MLEIQQVSDQNKTQAVKSDFTDSRLCDIFSWDDVHSSLFLEKLHRQRICWTPLKLQEKYLPDHSLWFEFVCSYRVYVLGTAATRFDLELYFWHAK